MSIHINAPEGAIAESVLLPGDPLRAKFIADNFLEDVVCYNEVRGMYGFTGTYKGKRISVQGTGMGIPSMSIYSTELIESYGVKNLIRVGTCGGYHERVKIRDLIIAMSTSTDSNLNLVRFQGRTYAPTASFDLLKPAYDIAVQKGFEPKVGSVYSSDIFYGDDNEDWKKWADFGCLGVEMETAALYTIAAKHKVNALTLLTVSDHFITGEVTSAEERQTTFKAMMEVALDTIASL
ncbi:purine-nucleoside phosphorylase [Clostridium botulinum]|uniref:Purine nucleoside phosphorylase DeoD-type n=2 Tax=Clostridium botulinum TaxID=1491 RepID=B2TKE4_CLOBB|nr:MULTISPECIES: purine-nucleoside phosphorylase [Clostridium]ACD24994.1 purine nucleoside phosphorylase [Clostridium botulinum B str. Eklund 17B (NRP)]AIY80477.1 purine nucleoside phosphorylase [Clostridium botulinum 202F]ACD53892.1 purine nucleoside phosphorylase [Clostridium botulinum E3 str. Alaska E43]AJF29490.1 purine nucleoside phosphorylase DeoD-type [Clostridium botulinum]AJF32551.1 purine nucleoside phosphorylase DeoD-type [Clostridium botulinum]